MKALSSVAVALLLGGVVCAQEPVLLGEPQPVDLKVTSVDWHPAGKGLIYLRDEENSVGLGTYTKGNFAGKVVLQLLKTDSHSIYWFDSQPSAIVMVRSAIEDRPGFVHVRLILVDVAGQTSQQIFSYIYDKKAVPNIAVDTSPLLQHAIITLRLEKDVRHLVLCNGATSLVPSTDLDRAAKQGISGPSWSVDGTAVYSEGSSKGAINISGVEFTLTNDRSNAVKAGSQGRTELILTSDAVAVSRSGGAIAKVKRFRWAPPAGSPVLELMPTNPILRPVRFRGGWVDTPYPRFPINPQNQPVVLQFGKSSQQDNCLWVRRGSDPSAPATLLAVHASKVWIDSAQTGVVFLIDGALFFRTIN